MTSRVCRCCGELMPEKPSAFSGNPNVCTACEDQSGVLQEPIVTDSAEFLPRSLVVYEESEVMRKAA
jgi:hypothetical protein